MSASVARLERGREDTNPIRRLLSQLEPDEGWLSLGLLLVLAGITGWSIANARWVLGRDELTSVLNWAAVLAALWGWLSARLEMSPWLAHLLGAAIGAFVLIEAVGMVIPGATPGIPGWFDATANSVTQAYLDLTWRHQLSTNQYGHFCLFLGILVWGTVQAAAYDVFGYHRAITGVLLLAMIFILNLALTFQDQFWSLVVFSGAALALLLQAHAADERTNWIRHRIWRGGDFQAPHLQGGVYFGSAAVIGALVLTTLASPAPLAGVWPGVTDNFREAATWLNAFLPAGGRSRINPGSDFGASSAIGWSFSVAPTDVFTVRMPSAGPSPHWRVVAYDTFKSTGWAMTSSTTGTGIPVNGVMTAGTVDQVSADTAGRNMLVYVVHVQDRSLQHLIVANEPGSVNVASTRLSAGPPGLQSVVWYSSNATDYTVTAYVPDLDPQGKGLTEWRLIHSGNAFPPGLVERYTQGSQLVGADGKYLLFGRITPWAKNQGYAIDPKTGKFANEFEAAKAIQDYLRNPNNFTYKTDITSILHACSSLSTVDCFALYQQGFCEQYATTMTMLMRMEGFPARYVEGYLPGRLEQYTLIQQVTAQQRHAWVEVYFPGYGWIPFDPTGGSIGQPTRLPAGSAVQPTPTPSVGPQSSDAAGPNKRPPDSQGGSTDSGGGSGGGPLGLLIPGGIASLIGLGLVFVWLRRPPGIHAPDTVYRGIVRLASRLGYKPLPTQTVYEYTGMLAEIVPGVRDPLGVVATAEVEVAYGRQKLGGERLSALAEAEQRVRSALLRLVFSLPGRRPKNPSTQARSRRR